MSTTEYSQRIRIYNARSGHDFVRDLLHNAIPGGSVESRKRVAAYQEEQEQRLTGMSVGLMRREASPFLRISKSIYSLAACTLLARSMRCCQRAHGSTA